jgi:hypothetical protein
MFRVCEDRKRVQLKSESCNYENRKKTANDEVGNKQNKLRTRTDNFLQRISVQGFQTHRLENQFTDRCLVAGESKVYKLMNYTKFQLPGSK